MAREPVDWVQAHGLTDKDETLSLLVTVGRVPAVNVFMQLFELDLLPDDAAGLVGDVWSMAEYPSRMLDSWEWERLFDWSGYRHDGEPASRPKAPLTLHRGAPVEYREWASGAPAWMNSWRWPIKPDPRARGRE